MESGKYKFYNSTRYKLVLCLSMAGFFYLFVIFFLPFGVDNYNPNHTYTIEFLLEIFYFFLAVFLVMMCNEFVLRKNIIKNVTPVTIILWSIWTFVLLSTVLFYTYNLLGGWHDYHLKSYFEFIVNCTSVLIFPTVGTFFYFRYQSLRKQIDHILISKEETMDSNHLITFTGQGSKDRISMSFNNFLYGRAQDNYVAIYYMEQQAVKKFLMRASLGKLVDSINHPAIIRSHRSYMVNLYHVIAVKGSYQDLKLYLEPMEVAIPISRSYREESLGQLKKLKNFS